MGSDEDEDTGLIDALKDQAGSTEARRTRGRDDCDHCGPVEGSVVTDRDDGWTLCRDCMNDPDILAEYAD